MPDFDEHETARANIAARVREARRTRDGTHQYTSTACYHDDHARCRLTCKFCSQPCLCPCHRSEVMAHA